MEKIGIFYGSTTGNTKRVAEKIQASFSDANILDVASASSDDLKNYDNLIFGISTWGFGDLQDDWSGFINELENVELSKKKVAIFGLGNQISYPDTFVDAMGELYNKLTEVGATIVGATASDAYDYNSSKAMVDGMFVGLVLDDDNEPEKTDDRISAWVAELSKEFE